MRLDRMLSEMKIATRKEIKQMENTHLENQLFMQILELDKANTLAE